MHTGNKAAAVETAGEYSAKRILYMDSHLAVFNKACGDICEACPDSKEDKAAYLPFIFTECFKLHCKGSCEVPDFIHCFNRLDRPVSGAVLLVFDKTLTAVLQRQFTARQKNIGSIKKLYKAVLEGCIPVSNDFTLLEHYLRFDAKKQKAFVCDKTARKAKLARLLWRPVRCTERYTYAEIELLTGRTHQIRCQLAHEGFYIKGDVKYGARRSDPLGGIRLHAAELRFEHPVTGALMDIRAPLLHTDTLWQACEDNKIV
ncbi:RNA pseudouridine synthase [Treponema sp. OMZ 840]|uniref:RluA family pseudouridine synthase n=1 Tax=Treponema sp. OMZ 840 TaxID=244313 RepID=UPI003D90438E